MKNIETLFYNLTQQITYNKVRVTLNEFHLP